MISIIAAMDRNRVIGKGNKLPWNMPSDIEYFKNVTKGKTIVMGRKTHESIGRVLPDRTNVILTKNENYSSENCIIAHTIEEILLLAEEKEIFIIGGANIYEQFLPFAQKLYLTFIDTQADGDVKFPFFDPMEWSETKREKHNKDEKNPHNYAFVVLERKS